MEKPNKQHYSFEAKKEVVERHLAGESMMDLAREFNLSSDHLVKDWVAKWRRGGDEALRPKPKGRPKGSAAPKRLTEEEKLRRQVERLEAENAYLKKNARLECQMRVFGTGVLGTRYCRVPGSWYRAEGCVGPDR